MKKFIKKRIILAENKALIEYTSSCDPQTQIIMQNTTE